MTNNNGVTFNGLIYHEHMGNSISYVISDEVKEPSINESSMSTQREETPIKTKEEVKDHVLKDEEDTDR